MLIASTSLAERVRCIVPPVSGVRWLRSAQDAAALRLLIRACYAESYSYAALYQAGTLEAAWEAGTLISLGEFVEGGALRGHTGFWAKDPAGDALESGLSLVDPARRRDARSHEKRVWNTLREGLAPLVGLVHQHTTTLHPMAQRYALRHLHARATGLIPYYACGESVLGLDESGADMHALCMTTRLCPSETLAPVWLPRGPWHGWLRACASALALDPRDEPEGTQENNTLPPLPNSTELIEVNDALSLRRRRAPHAAFHTGLAASLLAERHRVELVHVPATAGITAVSHALRRADFVPCGVHVRGSQKPHDVVFVHAAQPSRVAGAMRAANLATPELRDFWTTWCEICERTS